MTMRTCSLLILGLAAGAAPAAAVTPADLQRCRALADDRARLACYDALAAAPALPAAPGPAPAPAAVPVPAAPAVLAPPAAPAPAPGGSEADFGRRITVDAGVQVIESRIEGPVQGWNRQTRFRLANGQVWQVIDGSEATLNLRDPVVRVRRAALGSFLMEFEGSRRTVRVRRVD